MSEATKPDGGPAFPVECSFERGGVLYGGVQTGNASGWVTGVSVRDYFAAVALQGMLASGHQEAIETTWIVTGQSAAGGLAMAAYGFADAMLKARGLAQREGEE